MPQDRARSLDPDRDPLLDPAPTPSRADPAALQRAAAVAVQRDDPPDRARYEQLLGKLLGGQLYDLVVREASPDDLMRLAKEPVDQAIAQVGRTLAKAAPSTGSQGLDAMRAEMLVAELKRELGPVAARYITQGPGKKLAEAISTQLQTSPETTVAVILLAAAAVYLGDTPIDVKHGFELGGGVKAEGHVDLGSLRHLAVQAIGVSLSYEHNRLKATAGGELLRGSAASQAIKNFSPRLLEGKFDDPATLARLTAGVHYALTNGGGVSLTGETDLQHGRVITGSLGAAFTMPLDGGGNLSLGVSKDFAKRGSGVSATFKLQVNDKFAIQGHVDPERESFVGVVLRF